MKTLTTILIAFAAACSVPAKPAPKMPATGDSQPAAWPQCPDRPDCATPNGTKLTGLVGGDRPGTIHTVTLTSGEVVTLP
jgi:hypothetical protein